MPDRRKSTALKDALFNGHRKRFPTKELLVVCDSCNQAVSSSDKLCPFCGSVLETGAWRNAGSKPSRWPLLRRQMMLSWLKLMPLAAFGLIVIYFAALVICLVVLALIFGSLAFLVTIVGRTSAIYGQMIGNAQSNGIGVALLLIGVVIALLLLLLGAHRFWQKRPPK